MNKTILFIGTFLSWKNGTKGVSEILAEAMNGKGNYYLRLTSTISNPFLRAFHILYVVLFKEYSAAHIDVFSGKSFYLGLVTGKIVQWRGKPLVLTLHGGRLQEFYEQNPKIVRTMLHLPAIIQTPSRFLQAFFLTKGFAVEYRPNPVQLNLFIAPEQQNKRIPFSLLWVRAFASLYHPELAVDILHQLQRKYPTSTLTMVGPDKGQLESVRKQIKRLGLENKVHIIGPLANNNLPAYFQKHSVYLNTTAYESFGMALVEAAACRIPTVSSSVGEIPFLWTDEEDILLCRQHSAEVFAKAVDRLFSDNKLAEALALNAQKKASTFDSPTIIKGWYALFNQLTN